MPARQVQSAQSSVAIDDQGFGEYDPTLPSHFNGGDLTPFSSWNGFLHGDDSSAQWFLGGGEPGEPKILDDLMLVLDGAGRHGR